MRSHVLSYLSIFLLGSCVLPACSAKSGAAYRVAAPAAPPPPTYAEYPPPGAGNTQGVTETSLQSAPVVAEERTEIVAKADSADDGDAASDSGGGGATTGAATGATGPSAVEPQGPAVREMFDIEARISIEVEKVPEAAAALRDLAKKHGGQVVSDNVSADSGSSSASFTLRVPAQGSEAFLNALDALGGIRSRQITARDIGKQYHDAQIYLRNLELTLKRYEEILEKAQDVKAILEIEREMTRIRAEIDKVKGDLRWMKDRAARATVYVTLYTSRPDTGVTFSPKAKFYPGVRFLHFADFRGDDGRLGFFGGGVSVALARWWSIDFDGLRRIHGDGSGLDAFLLTIGGEAYSDFLGGGRRSFLNPYVGVRVGYGRILGKDEAIAGGTVGLEIYKTKFFRLDAQTRVLGIFGNKHVGGHLGLQSAIAMYFAF